MLLVYTYNHKYFQEQEKCGRSWFSLGREVGLEVVEDEKAGIEEDQSEKDRDVQKIMDHGMVVKILTGNRHILCQRGRNCLNIF